MTIREFSLPYTLGKEVETSTGSDFMKEMNMNPKKKRSFIHRLRNSLVRSNSSSEEEVNNYGETSMIQPTDGRVLTGTLLTVSDILSLIFQAINELYMPPRVW